MASNEQIRSCSALVRFDRHDIDDVQHIVGRFYRSHNFHIFPLILPRLFLIVQLVSGSAGVFS